MTTLFQMQPTHRTETGEADQEMGKKKYSKSCIILQ